MRFIKPELEIISGFTSTVDLFSYVYIYPVDSPENPWNFPRIFPNF